MYRQIQFTNTTAEQLSCNWRQEDTDKKEKSRDWSKMQDDISRLIVSKLRFYPHQRNFASACNEWYRLTKETHGPFQDGIPFLLLPYNYEAQTCTLYDVFNSEKHEFHLPELSGKFVHACSNGWIAVMDDSDFELSLFNPLTRSNIQLPKPIYAIEDHEMKFPLWEKGAALHPLDPFSRYDLMTKLVISQDGKMVAAILLELDMVVMCRIGDDSWTILEEEEMPDALASFPKPANYEPLYSKPRPKWYRFSKFEDFVFFEGDLYRVSRLGNVIIVNLSGRDFETRYVRAPKREITKLSKFTNYLVECGGDLLLVTSKGKLCAEPVSNKTCTFEIFRFEKDTETWSRIYEIGESSLFLGLNRSISVSARDFIGCRPNCIYFATNYYFVQDAKQIGYQHDNGVFCFEDGNVEILNISHSMQRWVTPASKR